uniref:P-type domain-containing protein n=1 Tax=Vannella robusta TaxID=1487602 RepID=A0A7S4IJL3_9EUKA|mmetsp:Transcript_3589/g.4449  ORF Transcript_3589/g.4449 Transcript_3589/m.4449 type:complete len:619 (+) Transcript_3589:3-1859(+)
MGCFFMVQGDTSTELRQRKTTQAAATVDEDDAHLEEILEKAPSSTWLRSIAIDLAVIVVLLTLTVSKLYYRIEEPNSLVWDETHFTKFSTWYVTGHYFVDIHPPLAKLIMAVFIWLSGYQPLDESNVQWWTHDGFVGTQDYVNIYNSDTYIYVRMGSLIAGSLLVLATYLTMRIIGCRRATAAFTTWMVMTDHLITIDSRIILTDVYLWMFHVMTIGCSFASTRAKSTIGMLFMCFVTGLLLGCTVSVKYTAFGTIGAVGIHQAVFVFHCIYRTMKRNFAREPSKRIPSWLIFFHHIYVAIWKALIILGVAAFVFLSVWIIHLHYLPYKGQGDGFMEQRFVESLVPYISEEQRALAKEGGCPNHANSWYDCGFPTITPEQCIERGCCWDPTSTQKWCYPKFAPPIPAPKRLSFWQSLTYMLSATWSNNQGEALNYHPQMSRWWQWPLLTCKFVDFGHGMYSMGNPAVWWLVALVVAVSSVYIVASLPVQISDILIPPKKQGEQIRYAGGMPPWLCFLVLVVGYLGNWVPFYLIVRSTWNYHYMLALLIGIILVGFSFDFLLRYYERKSRQAYLFVYALMIVLAILMGIAFWYWSPWVYGFPLKSKAKEALRWYHLWGV